MGPTLSDGYCARDYYWALSVDAKVSNVVDASLYSTPNVIIAASDNKAVKLKRTFTFSLKIRKTTIGRVGPASNDGLIDRENSQYVLIWGEYKLTSYEP